MKSTLTKSLGVFTTTLGVFTFGVLSVANAYGQAPAPRTGPGVQAAQDAREPEVLKTCKVPPPAAGGRGRGPGAGGPPPGPRDYTVTEIPGVIAAGQKWKEIWRTDGNNADGIIATKDGGLLIAQNDNSTVLKLDKDGKATVAYSGLNTSGAVSMNKKGDLFVNNRGLKASIEQLAPKRRVLANSINGDPLDCIGTVLNDLSADSKGGAYFTEGGLYYADAKGVVKQYGENLRTNGVILSPDEKTLYVTNGPSIAAFDVQKDGSLKNQREFVKLQGGGGDGSTVDAVGRLYVTTQAGVEVIGPDGKYLGLIPTPRGVITCAFSGPDKKTLYAVISRREGDPVKMSAELIAIPMIAQGYKGRAK
jgi:gluconolactonase